MHLSRPTSRRLHRRIECHVALDGMGLADCLWRNPTLPDLHPARNLYSDPSQIQSATTAQDYGRQPVRRRGGNQRRDFSREDQEGFVSTLLDSLPRAHRPCLCPLHHDHLHRALHVPERLHLHLHGNLRRLARHHRTLLSRHHHRPRQFPTHGTLDREMV